MQVDREDNEKAEREFNDRLATTYFEVWDSYPIQRYTNAVEQSLLARLVAEGSTVLVLGVGGGRELPVLLGRQCEVVAVDVSEQMLRLARERYGHDAATWVLANVSHLPEGLGPFDVVVAVGGVMNYQLDLASVLADVAARTVEGGLLVFDSFNKEFPGERPEHEQAGRVRKSYSVTELKAAMESAGFGDISLEGHRFFVDQVPAQANREPEHAGRKVLEDLIALEPRLAEVLPAHRAKILVGSGRLRRLGRPTIGARTW